MLKNLSIKSRLIFVIAFLSVLLVGIGIMGLASLNNTNASLKSVYEDQVAALGRLERVSALINKNQILVGASVAGQLSAFPEDIAVVDRQVDEIRKGVDEININWKAFMATRLTAEEAKLAEEFNTNRLKYARDGFLPALAALAGHDFQQAGEKYRSMSKMDQEHLIDNLVADLTPINKQIQQRVITNLIKADPDLGKSVAKGLKL